MGDHEGWAQPSSVPLNGLLANEVGGVTRILDADRWSVAEARTAELIERIQPNRRSEERRNAVASYVQRLIMKCFSCQVFTFGSVPLKTYLPDGDIDMTAFSKNLNLKDTWANDVRDMLENEEKSENAEFHVKEVQYIQAEVKIIKCLVENIVVDISFNQLGGLCTLCFLEEIDQVIDQDHLFKRSIILIKAWCYYESRILGAHHGLISTYALEILVLYIFHMFNNSFAGPLEVLYRFLEFFSNFDWDDFCVSLWGPVLISSLPDMTAEPPRKDNGKLLLSKQYLDDCSTKYSVFPGGQENQGQPFVSKFFNVIDPLRTNNNLGRSVSKGNFYRIRSAFAFGAKRLAGLLECPKDNLIAEVNKFFMNTWRQHGSGHRPDAPSPKLQNMQPLSNTGSVDFPENFRNHAIHKMMVEDGPLAGHGDDDDQTVSPQGVPSHSISFANQPTHNRTGNLSATSAQIQRNYINQNNSRVTDRFERTLSSSGHVPSDGGQQASRPDYLENGYQGQGSGRFQFARTRSSPELSDTSADVSSRRRTKMQETVKSQVPSARPEHSSRRKNLGSEMVGSRSGKSSANDPSSVRHGSSKQNFDVTDDSNCSSNSYHEDSGFVATNEEFTSFPEVSGMHQEEQDLVNMIAASSVGNFNGQVQLPMNTPAHLPFPSSSSVLASMGYLQQNLTGIHSESIPLIKPHWGSVVQFPHDLDSTQMANYYPNAGLASNPEEFIESGNESSGITEAEPEDVDHGFWPDQDNGSIRMSVTGERNVQMLHSDDRNVSSTGGFNSSSSRVSNSGSYTRGQRKLVRDNRGLAREDFSDTLNYQNNRGQDTYTSDRNLSLRFMASTPTSPSRSKSSSESSWDGSSTKLSRLARDKHGRKATSTTLPSPYGKSKSGRQYEESSSDHVSISAEDDNKEWIPLSTMGTDVVERSTGSGSLGPMDSQVHQSSGYESTPDYESTQTSSSDSMVPVAPVLVSASSRPRTGDNAGMMPFAFYATGPPVPYLTMLPVYPYNSGNSNGTTSQLDNGRLENGHTNPSDQNFESTEDLEQTDLHISTGSMEGTSFEHSEEHKPDILNSDLASHWKHLQFGRLCQNTRPMMYPSPVVTPMYLQGHFPWDGPGRPLLANMNLLTQFMNYPQFVPVAQLPPGQSRPSGMYRRYGDEVPRYRGGTGTYLPNPKVSSRDRQASNARNHRGNYGHERRDHGDREGSWINSKSRAAGRTHGRNQTEKPGSRSEWLSTADNRPEKPWNSYRRDPLASYQNQNSSFSSTSIHGSANMAYSMYPLPAVNSNGMSAVGPTVPSVMMLYSYDPGASHASSSEQLEFGSLGPVHFSPTGEVAQDMDGGPVRDTFDQKQGAYQQGSTHSSPDQPSSPQIHQRSTVQRNYQLKDEDFPPLSFPHPTGIADENYDYKSSHYQALFSRPHS